MRFAAKVVAVALPLVGACTCAESPRVVSAPAPSALDASAPAQDAGVDGSSTSLACTDFYAYACQDWLASHPLPADASYWSLYDEITKKNRATVQAILEETSRPGAPARIARRR